MIILLVLGEGDNLLRGVCPREEGGKAESGCDSVMMCTPLAWLQVGQRRHGKRGSLDALLPRLDLVSLTIPPSPPPSTITFSSTAVHAPAPPQPTITSSGTAHSSHQSSFPFVVNTTRSPRPDLKDPRGKLNRYSTFACVSTRMYTLPLRRQGTIHPSPSGLSGSEKRIRVVSDPIEGFPLC